MVIPSKTEIIELEDRIRTKLNEREGFEFTGKINIDVRPYLTADLFYEINTEKEPFEIDFMIYSARYPESYYNWEKPAIQDIRQKIVINRLKKTNEGLKQQIIDLGGTID